MKLNKTLLTLGTLAAVVTPIATVVSCGDKTPTTPANTNPTKGNTGNQGPSNTGNQGPSNTGNQGPSNTGNPSTATIPVSLKEGILDFRSTKTLSNQEINDAFDKFTTNIQLFTGSFGGLDKSGKEEMDTSKKLVKTLFVATPTSNHGTVSFYAGVIGYSKTSNKIYFTFKDFEKVSDISDKDTAHHTKQIELSNLDPGDKTDFDLFKGTDSNQIVARLKEVVATKFS